MHEQEAASLGRPGAPAEPLRLRTGDGVELSAWWLAARQPDRTVVLAHGFSANGAHPPHRELAEHLRGEGANVLLYDARGHGASGGLCGVGSTEHRDIACMVAWAAGKGAPVVVVGVSMGAVAAVSYLAGAAGPPQAAGAVLVSAPARWRVRLSAVGILSAGLTRSRPGRSVAARYLGVRVAPGWRLGAPPASVLRRVTVPVAVVHGRADRLLATRHGRLLAAAGEPRALHLVEHMGHGLSLEGFEAVRQSVRWVLDRQGAIPTTTPAR